MHSFTVSTNFNLQSPFSKFIKLSNLPTKPNKKHDAISLPSHVKSITSPSNPFVKHCVKLRQSSSYRHSHASVVVVGSTPIREITRFCDGIEEGSSLFQCLLLLDGAEVPQGLGGSSVRIVHVSSMVMKKLSGLQSIDAIQAVALLNIPSSFCLVDENHEEENFRSWFTCPHRILVLDGIQDPGNLGTLVRSAVAFRWDGVYLLPGCCDPFNDKALRASRGACFQLPIVSGNWNQLDNFRNGFQMKMLAGHPERKASASLSQNLADSLMDKHVCLILGSEGLGLSEQSELKCELVSIPMAGDYESLNVSVADYHWTVRAVACDIIHLSTLFDVVSFHFIPRDLKFTAHALPYFGQYRSPFDCIDPSPMRSLIIHHFHCIDAEIFVHRGPIQVLAFI